MRTAMTASASWSASSSRSAGVLDDRPGGAVAGLAGDDVGPVPVHRDEHGLQGAAQGPLVLLRDDPGDQAHEPVDLGRLDVVDDEPLGGGDRVLEGYPVRRVAGPLGPEPVEGLLPRPVGEHLLDPQEGVVAGGPRTVPALRELLLTLEDLLDDDPAVAGPRRERLEVAARVGEPVRVVDPEPVDGAVPVEGEEERVGRGEDHGVLDAHRDEGGDIEEASVVEPLGGLPPARETVGLGVEQLAQREMLGAGTDRELVAVVPDHPFAAGGATVRGEDDIAAGDRRLDAAAEDGHEDPVVLDVPVHVEPRGERRPAPLAQERPQRCVEVGGPGHHHVVGDDIDDDAHPVLPTPLDERVEVGATSGLGVDPGVVEHVVAVGRPGCRLEDRGEVHVGDPEGGEIGHLTRGVQVGEATVDLEAVGGDRHRTAGAWAVLHAHARAIPDTPAGGGAGLSLRQRRTTTERP
jgi:hypothetical protein